MKKIFLILLFISAGFLICQPVLAAEERIENFAVQIKINPDASIEVQEEILYNFDIYQRHGIYRDIPIKYSARGGNYNLRISDISITNAQSEPIQFTQREQGKNLRLKIGDPDKFITGQNLYVIKYKILRALNYFDEHDELYWNATGNEWAVPIHNVQARVILPSDQLTPEKINTACFAGPLKSDSPCQNISLLSQNNSTISAIQFNQTALAKNQGLTIVIGWPKNLITPISWWQNFKYTLADNGILLLPLIVLVIMYYLWHTRGKDPIGRGTIIPEYNPPANLTPAEIGGLIDERINQHDISAEIINLAVLGYLKITRLPKKNFLNKDDYQLDKLKSEEDLTNSSQKYLMQAIFKSGDSVKLSKLKNKFYDDLQILTRKIWDNLIAKDYFPHNPKKIVGLYSGIGGAIVLITVWFLTGWLSTYSVIALVASGVIIVIFGFFMPVKTQAGVHAKEAALGFKMFLSVTEKDRMKFHNAPSKDPKSFEKFLPFAMVFKVEKEWAEQFKDIYTGSPSWYADSSRANFSAWHLTSALNNFSSSANTTLSSRPGSKAAGGGSGFSGGFSGGGFGGGGGGSW